MSTEGYWVKLAAAEYLVGPNRCPICGWTLAKTMDEGCVIDNCSQRSEQQEQNARMRGRRADFNRLVEIISRFTLYQIEKPAVPKT